MSKRQGPASGFTSPSNTSQDTGEEPATLGSGEKVLSLGPCMTHRVWSMAQPGLGPPGAGLELGPYITRPRAMTETPSGPQDPSHTHSGAGTPASLALCPMHPA